jgi:hypothetical protein
LALQAQQIVTLANQKAKCPGFTSQAGQLLNVILSDLAQLNDFELSRGLIQINTAIPSGMSGITGQPYYNLASDHLHILKNGVFYLISGVPYTLIQKELSDFDQLITTQGFTSQLVYYAVDDSQTPPQIYFWPPPNAAYIVNVRYAKLRPDIATPEVSATIPWFPQQQYLITELTAEMMEITNDDRADNFHKKAADILRKWLTMQRDAESYVQTVTLDRNRFSTPYTQLKNTKSVGF